MDRLAGGLAGDVPERDLDAAHRLRHEPGRALSAPQPRPRAREDDVWRARIAPHDEARERFGHDRVRDAGVLAAPTVADLAVPDHAGVGLDLHEAMGEERGPERVRGAALRRIERHRDRDRGEPRDRGHARSVSCQ